MALGGTVLADEPVRREWPGVTADRETRTVRVEAWTTGVAAREPMEFFLIYERSGHDYEAYAVTPARPSHVHEALEFIGLGPGRHVDPERLRFWPEGDRVEIRVEERDGDGEIRRRYRAEDTILNLETDRALPPAGFVFAGSLRLDRDDRLEGEGYAADAHEPHAIVTFFNLPATVLDIPRAGAQGDLYHVQVRHPDHVPPEGTPLRILLSPAPPPVPAGWRIDVRLAVEADDAEGFRFHAEVEDDPPAPVSDPPGFPAWARAQAAEGLEVWCTPRFAEELTLATLREAAGALDRLVRRHDLRITPPPAGELYYQAFVPNPRFRDRPRRHVQPWEVHLTRGEDGLAARMVRVERDREASTAVAPVYREAQQVDAADPEALRRTLDETPGEVPVLLVFAPMDATLAELRAWLGPALPTHPVVLIYPDVP